MFSSFFFLSQQCALKAFKQLRDMYRQNQQMIHKVFVEYRAMESIETIFERHDNSAITQLANSIIEDRDESTIDEVDTLFPEGPIDFSFKPCDQMNFYF